ncbi:TolC family outer membrane protein [Ferrigenium sp. UT5]|uniref:TolC family outer membrane protein n=1 Tax=Ferrigenium sp. UT5 TaxID=3242105 RepID=UPI0035530BA0
MKRLRFALLLLLPFSLAAPAAATDLLAIYRAAQDEDALFAAARAEHRAGQEKIKQGRALLLPSLTFATNTTFNDITTDNASPFISGGNKRYNTHGYGFNLVQPLFREQNWAAYNQAELQTAIADTNFRLSRQDLILRVAQTYFDVLIAQDTVQLTGAQKSAIAEQLEQAKRNFEVGSATITDTYEAQARYDLILAQELVAANDLEVKRRALQQMLNTAVGELDALGAHFDLRPPVPEQQQAWIDIAHQNSLPVELAQAAFELAEREVERSRGGHLPTLDIVAGHTKNVQTGGNFGATTVTSKTVGLQLNMPLFEGGATQSKWREAEANREKARQELENARRTAELQTRQAYLGVATGMAQVRALQQAMKSNQSLLEASKLGQEVGVRTNLDVLNAQQQVFATRRDLLQAQYTYLLSHLRLKAAAGNLQEADLEWVNQALH